MKAASGHLLLIYAQNTSTSSKLTILAPVVDLADAELPEGGRAHNAWFNRHVEDCIFEKVWVSRDGVTLRGEGRIPENVVDCF